MTLTRVEWEACLGRLEDIVDKAGAKVFRVPIGHLVSSARDGAEPLEPQRDASLIPAAMSKTIVRVHWPNASVVADNGKELRSIYESEARLGLIFVKAFTVDREEVERFMRAAFTPYVRKLGRELTHTSYDWLAAAITHGRI